jgi:hypothetical protein
VVALELLFKMVLEERKNKVGKTWFRAWGIEGRRDSNNHP